MKAVFADTVYWIALSHPQDQWADAAAEARGVLGKVRIIATDEVLAEFLDAFASGGNRIRSQAARMVREILNSPNVRVIPQSRRSFLRGVEFYALRADKGYSLTDCVSMTTMRRQGIQEVLTSDRHFTQEGFTNLMPNRA
jgi:predicted nucleic acid-binding protein